VRNEGAYKELLAPLATSRSGLMILLAGDLGPLKSSQRQYIEHILQLNEHLIGIINEWEELERLSSGRVALNTEACNIGLIVRQAATRSIVVKRSSQWPMVLGDSGRLLQMFDDIFKAVGNAKVRARVSGGMCIVTVETNAEVNRQTRSLWIKAIRGEATKQYLGLRIARLLAEVHGGGLKLDYHATGGARFHVRLPLAQQMSLLGDAQP